MEGIEPQPTKSQFVALPIELHPSKNPDRGTRTPLHAIKRHCLTNLAISFKINAEKGIEPLPSGHEPDELPLLYSVCLHSGLNRGPVA
jgi:hypothetical protein